MENKLIRIAIDGPSGAGKSTIAKALAKDLGIDYIDTGAMYRALALKLIRTGTDYNDSESLQKILDGTDVDFNQGHVYLDGEDVAGLIRTPEVSEMASASSAVKEVREKLLALQQALGLRKSLVMDGRDICSYVLPFAEYKFYLTASVEVRTRRRILEMEQKGMTWDEETIKKEIVDRDYRDMHRENSPLAIADDATVIDSSEMNIDQVIAAMKAEMDL